MDGVAGLAVLIYGWFQIDVNKLATARFGRFAVAEISFEFECTHTDCFPSPADARAVMDRGVPSVLSLQDLHTHRAHQNPHSGYIGTRRPGRISYRLALWCGWEGACIPGSYPAARWGSRLFIRTGVVSFYIDERLGGVPHERLNGRPPSFPLPFS